MTIVSTLAAATSSMQPTLYVLAQSTASDGPMGPEFGKASPIGLLVLALMGVAVLTAGWFFHRRYSRFRRRQIFAQDHGIDPFDQEALDAAMKDAGIYDNSKKFIF